MVPERSWGPQSCFRRRLWSSDCFFEGACGPQIWFRRSLWSSELFQKKLVVLRLVVVVVIATERACGSYVGRSVAYVPLMIEKGACCTVNDRRRSLCSSGWWKKKIYRLQDRRSSNLWFSGSPEQLEQHGSATTCPQERNCITEVLGEVSKYRGKGCWRCRIWSLWGDVQMSSGRPGSGR